MATVHYTLTIEFLQQSIMNHITHVLLRYLFITQYFSINKILFKHQSMHDNKADIVNTNCFAVYVI